MKKEYYSYDCYKSASSYVEDIVIVDYFTKLTTTELSDDGIEAFRKLNFRVLNIRKYRGRIEKRKEKIKKIYG